MCFSCPSPPGFGWNMRRSDFGELLIHVIGCAYFGAFWIRFWWIGKFLWEPIVDTKGFTNSFGTGAEYRSRNLSVILSRPGNFVYHTHFWGPLVSATVSQRVSNIYLNLLKSKQVYLSNLGELLRSFTNFFDNSA